jgi:plasmid stabilization system protein ParE
MGKGKEVVWSLQAQIDFYKNIDFIKAVWNDAIAGKFISSIQYKVNLIEKFPLIGRKVLFPKRCRKVLIKPYYSLFYRISHEKNRNCSAF